MLKKTPKTMTKAFSPKQKVRKLMTEIGGGWYMEKIPKELIPLRTSKLNKKGQEKEDKTKIYKAKKWWDDCKFQLYWYNLE